MLHCTALTLLVSGCAKSLKAVAAARKGAGSANVRRHNDFEVNVVIDTMNVLRPERSAHVSTHNCAGFSRAVGAAPHRGKEERRPSRSFWTDSCTSLAGHSTCRTSKWGEEMPSPGARLPRLRGAQDFEEHTLLLLSNGRLVCACMTHIVRFINRS